MELPVWACIKDIPAKAFANSFIIPKNTDNLNTADLFPEDFIHCLKEPTNYFGPNKLFIPRENGTFPGGPRGKWGFFAFFSAQGGKGGNNPGLAKGTKGGMILQILPRGGKG